jgi:hypothetical protein
MDESKWTMPRHDTKLDHARVTELLGELQQKVKGTITFLLNGAEVVKVIAVC